MVDFNKLLWDRRFLRLAKLVATWSKDPSTQIGAVLVKDKRIVATGYNGFPPGIADDERLHNREEKYPLIVHGEMNALLQAGHDARGSTMYCSLAPCIENCAKHIITAGVTRVVFIDAVNERWAESQAKAEMMFKEAGVITRKVPMSVHVMDEDNG